MTHFSTNSSKWFEETVDVPLQARELLEKYSGIPPDEVQRYIIELRNKAWAVCPYPCLGQFRFLDLNLANWPGDLYPRLLARLQAGEYFLDVGCCLGQDLRKLVFDGVPAERLVGAELQPEFVELGYDLFRDRPPASSSSSGMRFIAPGDILDLQGELMSEPNRGKFGVVQLGNVLHLFGRAKQATVLENAMALATQGPGAWIIGQAAGNLDGLVVDGWDGEDPNLRHNEQTFRELVDEVAKRTDTRWKVKAELGQWPSVVGGRMNMSWDEPGTRRLVFELERC